jgi:(p)ppGpp synthase/HD superfamily hydrolase
MFEKVLPPSAPNPERMETVLAAITAFADRAHGQQTRRYTPERYIVHPVRVMELCREYTPDEAVLAAALLHDVLEDTPVTRAQMTEFLLTVMAPEAACPTPKRSSTPTSSTTVPK